jgi:sulfate permease, SulP family
MAPSSRCRPQLLSKPVLVGYISGVGMVLLSSQLSAFTGVPITTGTFFPRIGEFLSNLDALRPATLLLATGSLALLLFLRRALPRAPGALIVVAAATTVTWALGLAAQGAAVIGPIPTGLPSPAIPDVGLADLRALLPVALGVTLVGYSDNMLTARAIAAKMNYRIDPNQELAGLASANLGAGILQGMPVSSSASRTAVPAALGSVTSLVGVIGASVVAVTLLVAGDLLAIVPRAALAAIIVAAAFTIIDLRGLRQLWQISRVEMGLAVMTSLTVMVLDVLVGVVTAVVLSIAVALVRMARPADAVLGGSDDVDGWVGIEDDPRARTLPGLLVYRFDAPLFFLNIERFRTRLLEVLEANPGQESWVVLDLEGVGDVDASAIDGLSDLLDELYLEQVQVVAVARANHRARDRLRRAGLLHPDGPLQAFPTINAAVTAFQRRTPQPTDEGPDPSSSEPPGVS